MVLLMRAASAMLAALVLCSCASGGQPVIDSLDPETAVTVTRTGVPLVLYRDNSGSAAHARDFIYVGPLRVNRMGDHRYYLWLGIWSAIGDQDISAQRDGFDSVVLFADGEPLRLDLEGWTPSAIGASEPPYPKPVASSADAYYRVTLDQIRLISEAQDLRLSAGSPSASFEPWDDQSRAMAAFRAFVSDGGY
jgi:hypothetical protein